MPSKFFSALLMTALLHASIASAQESTTHAYTEGPVVVVSYIRTGAGKFEEYMNYLASTFKRQMEEYKRAGVILDYGVYLTIAQRATDPDVLLTVTYKNYAALDGQKDKTDPIDRRIWGSVEQAAQASGDRDKMRVLIGGQIMRELILK